VARRRTSGITFHHPAAFWFGAGAVTAGVLLHLPMFFGAKDSDYHLVGMQVNTPMKIGMGLTIAGMAATAYGLFRGYQR